MFVLSYALQCFLTHSVYISRIKCFVLNLYTFINFSFLFQFIIKFKYLRTLDVRYLLFYKISILKCFWS